MTARLVSLVAQLRNNAAAPRARVAASLLIGAGRGVFAARRIGRDEVVTLYPGYYYPPPPVFAMSPLDGTPALQVSDINDSLLHASAYKMSCSLGGFIDASREEVDLIPHAVGHIVNHSASKKNATVESFWWRDVGLTCSNDDDEREINRLDTCLGVEIPTRLHFTS